MINDRQFLISKKEFKNQGWNSVLLPSGYILSYHKKLPVIHNENLSCILLGYAWQTDPQQEQPADIIKNGGGTADNIIDLEKTWCGRYVVIVDGIIYMDAAGLLCVFYDEDSVSSSLNLLCEVENIKLKYPKLYHGMMPDFLPGKLTVYPNIKRLLPSQTFDYVNKNVEYRTILPDGIVKYESDDERIEDFIERFTTGLHNMKQLFPNSDLWLAITGGRDSRTCMSLLEGAGIAYKTFTLEHDNISDDDVRIPNMLSKKVGKQHKFIRREGKPCKKKQKEYDRHCAGMAVDEDRNFYAYSQYKKLLDEDKEIVILRSSIWECVIEYYNHFVEGRLSRDNIFDAFKCAKYDGYIEQILLDYLDFLDKDPYNFEWSFANRILYELRSGCWMSSIEQSYDIMDGIISIQPANCRWFLSTLMGFDEVDRCSKAHQEKIIQRACGDLNEICYEGSTHSTNNAQREKRKSINFKKMLWCIKNWGIKNTVKYKCY